MKHNIIATDKYLIAVDDSEIAIGDIALVDCSELEVLDVRKVVDYYNEHFLFEGKGQIHMDYCKKIIANLPLNNAPILEGVDLLPKTMNNEPQNKFQAMNWSQYGQASNRGPIESTFQSALMDCEHTHEFGAEAQNWKEYSEVVEMNATGDVINSTYLVTL